MNKNLVVAAQNRTEKTICLVVPPPALKAYGILGRPRLFEVIQKIKQVIPSGKVSYNLNWISPADYMNAFISLEKFSVFATHH